MLFCPRVLTLLPLPVISLPYIFGIVWINLTLILTLDGLHVDVLALVGLALAGFSRAGFSLVEITLVLFATLD